MQAEKTKKTETGSEERPWYQIWLRALTSWPVRIAGTLFCLWLISLNVDFKQAFNVLRSANWGLIFVGWLVTATVLVCGLMEWAVLVRSVKPVPWRTVIGTYVQTLGPAQLLPAGIGGEAVRIYQMSSEIGVAKAGAAAAMARVSSSLGLALWALWGAVNIGGTLAPVVIPICATNLLIMLTIWSLTFWPDSAANRLVSFLSGLEHSVATKVISFVEALRTLGHKRSALILSLVSATVGWGLNFYALTFFSTSTGATIPWHLFALAVPLSLMTTLAPFVMNGLGLREGVLISVFSQAGASSSQAAVIALLVDIQLAPFVLISAVSWMIWTRAKSKLPLP